MNRTSHACDVLVIGGGPAGLAAAYAATRADRRVTVVDDNPGPGGQIWRGDISKGPSREAASWFERIRDARIDFIKGARVFDNPEQGRLLAETTDGLCHLSYQKLILATGARERFLPFPGWTKPNVMGAGGLQALVKSGLSVEGKRVVIAGTGPLLFAVAAYLRTQGAKVCLIAEQSGMGKLLRLGLSMARQPAKLVQAIGLRRALMGVPYLTNCWLISAQGDNKLTSVTLKRGNHVWQEICDYLACGFHLTPNLELARLLGCEIKDSRVHVDESQQTSIAGVYSAGESTGIGGLDLSLVEGQIAGYAATGNNHEALKLFAARRRHGAFTRLLNQTFSLREELKSLPEPSTIVCRCEDVTMDRLRAYGAWREAKLQTRCGMGPCQGRICGAAIEFLLGWQPESVRPPVFPARLSGVAAVGEGLTCNNALSS